MATACRNGFKISGNGKSCVSNAGTCGTTTCDAVRNGAVDCVSGSCVYSTSSFSFLQAVVDEYPLRQLATLASATVATSWTVRPSALTFPRTRRTADR